MLILGVYDTCGGTTKVRASIIKHLMGSNISTDEHVKKLVLASLQLELKVNDNEIIIFF